MAKPRGRPAEGPLHPALEEIIDMGHPLVQLADKIESVSVVNTSAIDSNASNGHGAGPV